MMRSRSATLTSATLGLAIVLGACASSSTVRATDAGATSATPSLVTADKPTSAPTTARAGGVGTTLPPPATVAPEVVVAGDIPDTQAFVTYSPASGGYSIKVPEGWGRSADGSATVFTDKSNTIRIETASITPAPTAASVTSGDLAAIAKSAPGYAAGKVTVVTRKAGQAILATYQMDGGANSVTKKAVRLDVERYVFWRSGKEVIITLSSAAGSDNVDPWKTVTDGFGWAG